MRIPQVRRGCMERLLANSIMSTIGLRRDEPQRVLGKLQLFFFPVYKSSLQFALIAEALKTEYLLQLLWAPMKFSSCL